MFPVIEGALLVALATSLGWGLRGEWGHWWGATVPGAFCGMAIWVAFGGNDGIWQLLGYGAALAVGLSLGGVLSYGIIVGYVKSEHDRSPVFGLLALFLVGGLWGFFGGTSLGLLLTSQEYSLGDLALWATLASLSAFLAYKLLVVGLDLHLSPPRSDVWAAVLGGAVATALYFAWLHPDAIVLSTAVAGWVGFGGGFSLGAFIHRLCVQAGWRVDSWKFMEHSVGFWGGLSLAASTVLVGGAPPLTLAFPSRLVSAVVVLWLVPYMNISNTFLYWYKEASWISRRLYAAFQGASLLLFFPFLLILNGLVETWEGKGGSPAIFAWLILFLTLVAIAKFRFSRTKQRLVIDATFLGEGVACLLLLLLS